MSSSLLGNRYQLQQSLGSGGMANIYRARDLMLDRAVAIKVLREDFSQDPNFRERFRQEARAAANLTHPNIVTVHDFGLDQGKLYIVMEFVPGADLKSMIRENGKFSIEESINLLVQACAGIGYAHRAGLVHCDVKPHNMLVTPDLRLKVTDFGIARALSTIHPDEHHDVVWGSPQYFSPEQAAGQAPSPASDVYSLGVILYEMLTGQLPFQAEDPGKLAAMHREVIPTPPRRLNSEITPELEQIMLKVMAKEPSARYRTAEQLGRILTTYSQVTEDSRGNAYSNSLSTTSGFSTTTSSATGSTQKEPVRPSSSIRKQAREERTTPVQIDWLTIGLGLLAAISVGGLVPFWLYIYLSVTTFRTIP